MKKARNVLTASWYFWRMLNTIMSAVHNKNVPFSYLVSRSAIISSTNANTVFWLTRLRPSELVKPSLKQVQRAKTQSVWPWVSDKHVTKWKKSGVRSSLAQIKYVRTAVEPITLRTRVAGFSYDAEVYAFCLSIAERLNMGRSLPS